MSTNTTRTARDPMDLLGLAVLNTAWWTIIAVGVTAWWALLFPMVSAPVGLAVAVGLFLGWSYGLVVVVVWIAGMVLWHRRSPETFQRCITGGHVTGSWHGSATGAAGTPS